MVVLSAGCGAEPPSKEMNQAQGAIDAARAAGADRFASEEFTAAVDALKRSDEAVKAGDYRQALSHAIDSRERAQNAAKMAVEGRANSRGDAERAIAEAATLLSRTNKTQSRWPGPIRVALAQAAVPPKRLCKRLALSSEGYLLVKKARDRLPAIFRRRYPRSCDGNAAGARKRH